MPPADPSTATRLSSSAYQLTIRQGPERAKVAGQGKEKDRKPIDPPPIIQLRIKDPNDPAQNFLQSPYYFVICNLWHATEDRSEKPEGDDCALSGTVVSSLHRLKDSDNADGGFFVFGDVSVKCEGQFRLRFTLFEMLQGEVISLQSIVTDTFQVFTAKNFPGMAESTFLSRSFGDQGVRLRIRKETRKRPASREANPADSQIYGQSRPDGSAMMGYPHSGYPPTRDYREYGEPVVKRQRSTGPYETSRAQDGWPYTQPQQGANLYASHNVPQGSTYAQVSGTNPPSMDSFTFRNHPSDSAMMQASMSRTQMGEYGLGQAQNPYDTQTRYTQDASGQYNDSQGTSQRMAQPMAVNRHTNPADHLQYQEMNRYGAVATPDQREKGFNYPAPPTSAYATSENGAVLPPLGGSGASTQGVVGTSTPYTYSSPDARGYPTHAASPAAAQGTRGAYQGYQPQYPMATTYT